MSAQKQREKGAWSPRGKYRAYLDKIDEVLDDGRKRTLRDVYYALEARGFAHELRDLSRQRALERHRENPEQHVHPDVAEERADGDPEWLWRFEYDFVKRAVKKGRRAEVIDPWQIFDGTRQAANTKNSSWDSTREFAVDRVDGIWNDYFEDYWTEQGTHVEVWLEKRSLTSVFEPICDRYNVRLEPTGGDWSDSEVFRATQRLINHIKDGEDVQILYFGDYNPSGFHAPVSILDTMGYYGIDIAREFPDSDEPAYYDVDRGLPARFQSGGTFDFDRIALNNEHIERFDLPENPVPSATNKDATIKGYFQQYVSDGRDTNVELNALKEHEREFLEELLEESIAEHVDEDVREEVQERIDERQTELDAAISIDWSAIEGGESA